MSKTSPTKTYFFIGSTNPVKVNSVKLAVAEHWPAAEVHGFEVASGVSAQPSSDDETKQGAENRAQAALAKGLSELKLTQGEFVGIGLEGGIFTKGSEMWSTVWCAVIDQAGNTFASNGARIQVPEIIAQRIRQGEEMGLAVQNLTGVQNVKHKHGMIGIITENFVDRTTEYSAITKLCIGLWYGRNWQKSLDILS